MNIEQAQEYLAALQEAYYSGVRKVQNGDEVVEFGSDEELQGKISELKQVISGKKNSIKIAGTVELG